MKLGDILSLRWCRDGDELFEKVKEILSDLDICVYDEYGMVKDIRELCWDIVDILNKDNGE